MANLLDMLLRAWKVILLSFVVIFTALLVLLAFKKDKYDAHMTFLIRSERAEDLVSADPAQKMLQQETETEERVNSEVALLGSAELLKAVVLDLNLEKDYLNAAGSNRAVAVEVATRDLSRNLVIGGVRRSALIDVSYTSVDRDRAKAVLDALSKEYLTQYSRLHEAGGAAAFYKAESDALEANLLKQQDERAKLLAESGYKLLPEAQKSSFDRIVELEKSRSDLQATLMENQSRLERVRAQQGASPDRVTTQRRIAANANLVSELSAKLADLQIRLTELRSKFVESDPFVRQVKQQMADTKAALDSAQGLHSEDVTTDVNPLRQTLDGEANQLNQSVAGLNSRARELDRQLAQQRGEISQLEQGRIRVDELSRNIKVLQDSVDLYSGRALAAAAAEQMDPEKFSNVVEASHPTVPVLPVASRFNVRSALLLSILLSFGIGLAYEWKARDEFDDAIADAEYPLFERAAVS